ncbi:hypothetical protein ACHAXT_005261 [Thalassiosira profunda]
MSEEAKEAPPAGEEAAAAAALAAAAGNGAENAADAGAGAPPAVVGDADAPAEAAAAPDAAAGGPAPPNHALPSLAAELSGYFANLQQALRRQMGASATGGGRSSVAQVLHEGAASLSAAGSGIVLFDSCSPPNGGAARGPGRGAPVTPAQAALYLYAVAQNIVALEAAVLGSRSAAAGGGGLAAGLDGIGLGAQGGLGAKQVQEIVAAAGIAATFCNSRSLVSESGILPALAHLIGSTGTVPEPPPPKNGAKGKAGPPLHALTPFHPDFLQICLLAGQYRYASAFLANHPHSRMTLNFAYLKLDPTTYLRTHYYAGLVHVGCENWNGALDSFHLCLTMPCGTNVSAVAVAARKKGLLVQCLLLESEELDGSALAGMGQQPSRGGGGGGKSKSALENRVLELPGGVSAAVSKYMIVSNNRVDRRNSEMESLAASGSGSAQERTAAGAETSEQRPAASRRRDRGANSAASSSDAAAGERASEGSSRSRIRDSHLGSYHDLVSTYISGNASHYAKLLAEMNELLHADGNWGLAKRLEGRIAYRAVRQVASVYSVVGTDMLEAKLAEVCSNLTDSGGGGEMGKRGVEDLLLGMAAGDAKDPLLADPFVAKIDHSTGTVSFREDDDDFSDDDSRGMQIEADLADRLQSCIALAERVRDLDVALTTSAGYRRHVAKEAMVRGSAAAAGAAKGQGGEVGASVADIPPGPMDIGDW